MQPKEDYTTIAMRSAIEAGQIKKFEELINFIRKPEQYRSTDTMRLMLRTHTIDTDKLLELAKNKQREKDAQASTICNIHFYKNLSLAVACFSSAALLAGFFIWIPISNQEFDFLKNGAAIGTVTSALTGLGVKHARSAWNNDDALNEYAKQLAITLLLQKLRTSKRTEPV